MATPRNQRIGIWIIAVVMLVGTVGSFAVMILANNNQLQDQQKQQQAVNDYNKQLKEQAKNNKPLDGYTADAFDKSSVTKLDVETLVQGTGTAATSSSTLTVNYFGWTSDGSIFDSTNKNGTTSPVDISLTSVIPGWSTGLNGVKAGSTVRLTIPSDQGYGSNGSAPLIGPNEPLKFIVQVTAVK